MVPNVCAIPLILDPAADHRLSAALEHASIVVYTTDLDLRYTWLANAYPGFTIDEMLGRQDEELFPAEAAALMTAFNRAVLASGQAATLEVPLRGAEDTLFYEIRAEPLLAFGATVGLCALAIDVTSRKSAELRAADNAERYRALAAATREAIVIHDT